MTPLPERPRLSARARKVFDRHEGRWVLLVPEKGLVLNVSSAAVLDLCTGEHRVPEIVDALAGVHEDITRERIAADVDAFLAALHARGLLREGA